MTPDFQSLLARSCHCRRALILKLACAALVTAAILVAAGQRELCAQSALPGEKKPQVKRIPEGAPEESILEQEETSTLQFLITLSGTVYKENFTGVQALLTLSIPPDASPNPYLLTIEGYPQRNAQNAFYWSSDQTVMKAMGTEITCEIKPSVGIRSGIHFFFLSPTLLEQRVFMTQLEKKRKTQAEAVALPTKIFAQAGKIAFSLRESTVSGTVCMTGYDNIEHSYVTYTASFTGIKTTRLRPKEELKK